MLNAWNVLFILFKSYAIERSFPKVYIKIQDSYCNRKQVLDAAKLSKVQAVHPGYGFLSENDEFANSCHKIGVIFVGPPASAIRSMGLKNEAKRLMIEANVPVIDGYHGSDQSDSKLFVSVSSN